MMIKRYSIWKGGKYHPRGLRFTFLTDSDDEEDEEEDADFDEEDQ